MKLFQLCGKNRATGFSPYGWRAKLCLLHKGLPFEEETIRFLEKDKLAHAPKQTIPVLEDGEKVMSDSFVIANYLEDTYPETDLFGGPAARAQAAAFNQYLDSKIVPAIFPHVILDLHACQDKGNARYFRESREGLIGMSLEEFHKNRGGDTAPLYKALEPFRTPLRQFPFLSGEEPRWLDYALMGTFMWPYLVSDKKLLAADDPLFAWRERMFGLFGGAAKNAEKAAL